MGNLDQAMHHFEDSLAFCRKVTDPSWPGPAATTPTRFGERDSDGDRAKAICLLDESLAICSELGMRPLMERVLSRREILKA